MPDQAEIERSGARVRVRGKLPVVLGYEAGPLQIVRNLVGNAVKFVAEGVTPEVEMACDDADRWWELWVRDNGIRIDPNYHREVFDLFRRAPARALRRHPGTGVGLALVEKAVDLHRGPVRVESVSGQGSVFRVACPSSRAGPIIRLASSLRATLPEGIKGLILDCVMRGACDGSPLRLLFASDVRERTHLPATLGRRRLRRALRAKGAAAGARLF